MDLRKGQPVEYLWEDEHPTEADEAFLGKNGVRGVLYRGHPGRVWFTDSLQHVMVNWVGLEDDPQSFAVGYNPSAPDYKTYKGLGILTEDEYQARKATLQRWLTTAHDIENAAPLWNLSDSG